MGQRHQVFVQLPAVLNYSGKVERKPMLIGVHHQWLYGQTAVILLRNLLEFFEKNKEPGFGERKVFDYTYNDPTEILAAIYTCDRSIGYYSYSVHELEKVGKHSPTYWDNNDGITIVNLGLEKYCFMSLNGIEAETAVPNLTPLSAHEYLSAYYPDYLQPKVKGYDGKKVSGKKAFGVVRQAIADLEKYQVLTSQEVKNIFPMLPIDTETKPERDAAVLGGKQDTPAEYDAVLGTTH